MCFSGKNEISPDRRRPRYCNSTHISLCLALFVLFGCSSPSSIKKSNPLDDGKRFTQEFYDWYVSHVVGKSEGAAWEMVLRQRPASFGQELLRSLEEDADARAQSSDRIVGIDFDPFLNTQDPASRYKVEKFEQRRGTYFAQICGEGQGSPQADVIAELEHTSKGWAFVNFHYPNANSKEAQNLRALLTSLSASRRK